MDDNAKSGESREIGDIRDVPSQELYRSQVEAAYSSLIPIVFGNLVNGGIIAVVMHDLIDAALFNGWIGALIVSVVLRSALFRQFHKRPQDDNAMSTWARWYCIGALATAALWGMTGWFFVIPDAPHTHLVMAVIIAGMVAGAMTTLRTLPQVFAAFAVVAVTPLIVRFVSFQQLEYSLLALAFMLFVVLMSLQAFNISRQLNVSEARRFTNQALVEDLRIAKQNAEVTNAAKSEFLATISHEIRTPMTGVMGFADGLLEDDLPPDSKSKVQRIKNSTQSLLKIINEVLDISKLEVGKMEIENLDFALTPVADEVVSMFKDSGNEKLTVSAAFSEGCPVSLNGDPTRLRQILINLVGNAVKFTKEGSVTLSIRFDESEKKHPQLCFAVTDTGIGIAENAKQQLFTDFTQADASITREYEGTGLGLAICRRLVERMGGEIGVDSTLGVGSTFWFTLPYTAVRSGFDEAENNANAGARRIETLQPLDILVAEDNHVNQMVIAMTFEALGHTIEMVNDGDSAVNAHAAKTFDLIVLDVRMPRVSGPDATKMIRRMGADKNSIPIIALTADVMTEHRQAYFDAGMNAVAKKPIDRIELATAINDAMGKEVHAFHEDEPAPTAPPPEQKDQDNQQAAEAVTQFLASIDGLNKNDGVG